ncbi:unnamed protein product [Orchesella dallaii]|uniref:Protein sleepless n=1 Tax=Orchesella dallaii TaxID=48710 RepID=A0ABP1Q234_9HEXA
MKWPRASLMLLTAFFGILLLDIEFATGLKCYFCASCGSDKGKEVDCELVARTTGADNEFRQPILKELGVNLEEPGLAANSMAFDRCKKVEKKDGTITKACATKEEEQKLKGFGVKCLEFAEREDTKACFCNTDLCNEAPKVIGNAKPLAFLSVVAFISIFLFHCQSVLVIVWSG